MTMAASFLDPTVCNIRVKDDRLERLNKCFLLSVWNTNVCGYATDLYNIFIEFAAYKNK